MGPKQGHGRRKVERTQDWQLEALDSNPGSVNIHRELFVFFGTCGLLCKVRTCDQMFSTLTLTFCKDWVSYLQLEVGRERKVRGQYLKLREVLFNNEDQHVHQLHPAKDMDGRWQGMIQLVVGQVLCLLTKTHREGFLRTSRKHGICIT